MNANWRPRAVVFDLDGLMFNTEEIYLDVGDALLRRRGVRYSDELRLKMMGRPGRVAMQIMIEHHGLPDTPDALLAESDIVFDSLLPQRLAPMTGLPELLTRLEAAGFPKAIATSSRRKYAERIVGQFAWHERFVFILTGDDVTHGKPHPEIYCRAAERLGVATSEMLVFEDSHVGCSAAVAAGAFAVAVPGPHSRDHDFHGAKFIANTLSDPQIQVLLGFDRACERQP